MGKLYSMGEHSAESDILVLVEWSVLVVPVISVDPARLWSNEISSISSCVVVVVVGKVIQIIITRTDHAYGRRLPDITKPGRCCGGCILMFDRMMY